MPLRFSIVVPTLNRRQMINVALASIRAQQWPDVQVIVADGGSTDGTVEELRDRRDIELVSGPDRGVYDAFNKGIARANGDLVGILNSDDSYEPGAFAAVASALPPDAAAVCGTALVVDDKGIVATFDDPRDKSLASSYTALIGAGCSLNARFFRRDAVARVGPFSLDYQYVSDRDWLVRWYELGLRTTTIPDIVYRYRQHAGSLTFDADRRREWAMRKELIRLARRWRHDAEASAETKRAANVLEGRCVATLAARAIRTGHLAEFGQWLLKRDGRPSLDPLVAATRGIVDRAAQALRRRASDAPTRRIVSPP
jgi:glycosyltransferase involved in cell wall biosynthesis